MHSSDHTDFFSRGFTHGGVFHADDIFSTAFLRILNPEIQIERGNTVPQSFDGIVFDIGGGQFDHHQKDSRIRTNGVPYAAFGLLWEQFGTRLFSEEDVRDFDAAFIQPLDRSDNTGEKNMICQIVADFNPSWQDETDQAEAFEQAVVFAKGILERRFQHRKAEQNAFDIVRKQAEKCGSGILYLERAMPWKEAVKDLDIYYVIYPSIRGGYNIQAVPLQQDQEQLKRPFPESWRGLDAGKLSVLTGVEDFMFCHHAGFLCAVKTPDSAFLIAELALKNKEN